MITSLLWLQTQDLQNLLNRGESRTPRVMEVMTHHHLALPYKLVGLSKGMKILSKMCNSVPQGIWGMHTLKCISPDKISPDFTFYIHLDDFTLYTTYVTHT